MPLIVIVLIAGDEGGYVCDSSNSDHFIMILKIAVIVILMELLITVIAMLIMITFMIAGATSR